MTIDVERIAHAAVRGGEERACEVIMMMTVYRQTSGKLRFVGDIDGEIDTSGVTVDLVDATCSVIRIRIFHTESF